MAKKSLPTVPHQPNILCMEMRQFTTKNPQITAQIAVSNSIGQYNTYAVF